MKLNLGDTVDILEPEKEAVPWLTGSVRISLADVEKREAAKKSRNCNYFTSKGFYLVVFQIFGQRQN